MTGLAVIDTANTSLSRVSRRLSPLDLRTNKQTC
jgi:hypothetical protein